MMTGLLARLAPAGWLRAPRPTARLRLTVLYGALFLLSGAALLAVTYLLVEQATAFIPLPGGRRMVYGHLPFNLPRKARPIPLAVQSSPGHLHGFMLHELLIRSGVALGLTAVICITFGWLVAGRVLQPVRTIGATARQIGASNLNERFSLDGPDDEFRELA